MAKQGVYSIEVDPVSLKNLLQTLSKLDKDTQNEVRDAALPLSNRLAGQLQQFADSAPSPQTKLVAQSIQAKRDRLIRVDVGGTKKVGRKFGGESRGNGKRVKQGSAPAGALLWGTEYGSSRGTDSAGRSYTDRFKAPRMPRGYWIAPAVEYYTPIVAKEYIEIVVKIIKREGLD